MGIKAIIQAYCLDKSVVVVGNSSSLLETNNGDFIDGFDIVVRMNHGYPRKEWAAATGMRTDIWVCAFNKLAQQPIEYQLFKPAYALRLNNETHIHPQMEPVFLRWNMENWEAAKKDAGISLYPSTGLVTIYFFLKYIGLKKLAATGFDFFETNNFYDPQKGKHPIAHRWHSPELEKQYFQQLAGTGRLSFF
ncbi:MAG: glycosyltransferase family 29 protein [Phaeodactylibacter sp.]|nr:glycosyltransferase family 29 protein [Phaeodactylibacter sp.]MCB9301691.1 glycosyltransferase family 29 protein [Lewinellaceae bacterium]